jgi:hypothetical protein
MKKIKTISILVFVFTVFMFSSAITQTNVAMAKTNTSNATTAVYGHPVLKNVTRDKDNTSINVDDFGFDVSQYENVTIYYL